MLTECKRVLRCKVFDKLFAKVSRTCEKKSSLRIKRRLLIRAPTYSHRTVADLTRYAKGMILSTYRPAFYPYGVVMG